MRRIVGWEVLLPVFVAAFLLGCSSSSSPQVADSNQTEVDIVIPQTATASPSASEANAGVTTRRVDDPSPPPARDPEIAEGEDSDTPGGYKRPAAEAAANAEHAHAHEHAAGETKDQAPKGNGRQPDGDDPASPLVVAKTVDQPDDAPLNNGRAPSATPLPEGERVAASPAVPVESLDSGRRPGAKPGADVTVSDAPPAKPAKKPAAPSRATLADLSEAVQELDKDKDGQLGVYEWPREKLAEFKTLDADKDGFLTPAELVAGQKRAAEKVATETDPAKTPDATDGESDSSEKAATDKSEATTSDDSADATDAADDSTDDDETEGTP